MDRFLKKKKSKLCIDLEIVKQYPTNNEPLLVDVGEGATLATKRYSHLPDGSVEFGILNLPTTNGILATPPLDQSLIPDVVKIADNEYYIISKCHAVGHSGLVAIDCICTPLLRYEPYIIKRGNK